jgi:hypothetical protein
MRVKKRKRVLDILMIERINFIKRKKKKIMKTFVSAAFAILPSLATSSSLGMRYRNLKLNRAMDYENKFSDSYCSCFSCAIIRARTLRLPKCKLQQFSET